MMKDISSWRPGVLLAAMWICSPVQIESLALGQAESQSTKAIRLEGSSSCFRAVRESSEEYIKEHPDVLMNLRSGGSYGALENLLKGKTDVAFIEYPLRKYVDKLWEKSFPNGKKPAAEYVFAQTALGIVVHKQNMLRVLTYNQIRDIWSGKITVWQDIGGQSGKIKIYTMQPSRNLGGCLLSQLILDYRKWTKDCKNMFTSSNVIATVAKDVQGIGIIVITHDLPKRVRLVAVTKGESARPVQPTVDNIVLEKYPLVRQYKFILTDKSSPKAHDFCRYVCSKQSEKAFKNWGLFPIAIRQQAEAAERLRLMKAGKGVPIKGVGSMGGSAVMRDLAIEYVKAKEVVQMACRPATSELTAVGYFVNSKDRELLVLDGPISEQAKKLHGKKWDFLEPETHVLATGRGIAICVNSMNKLGSLTLEQVRHLFSKKTATWRDVTGAEVKIKRYGLAGTDPAARVFYSRINPPAVCARPDTRLGTQAVLAALSRDPHGIAFVDAAAANDLLGAAGGKSGIKVLSIGAKGKAASPTAANVKAGKYPISQQLTLHLSPRASQTTRDFVKFVLSGAADEVFTKHGLITPAQARKATAKKPTGKKPRKRTPKKSR